MYLPRFSYLYSIIYMYIYICKYVFLILIYLCIHTFLKSNVVNKFVIVSDIPKGMVNCVSWFDIE